MFGWILVYFCIVGVITFLVFIGDFLVTAKNEGPLFLLEYQKLTDDDEYKEITFLDSVEMMLHFFSGKDLSEMVVVYIRNKTTYNLYLFQKWQKEK